MHNIGIQRYNTERERWKKVMNSTDSKEIWSEIKWNDKDTEEIKTT